MAFRISEKSKGLSAKGVALAQITVTIVFGFLASAALIFTCAALEIN
jgi:hypothetical protein